MYLLLTQETNYHKKNIYQFVIPPTTFQNKQWILLNFAKESGKHVDVTFLIKICLRCRRIAQWVKRRPVNFDGPYFSPADASPRYHQAAGYYIPHHPLPLFLTPITHPSLDQRPTWGLEFSLFYLKWTNSKHPAIILENPWLENWVLVINYKL